MTINKSQLDEAWQLLNLLNEFDVKPTRITLSRQLFETFNNTNYFGQSRPYQIGGVPAEVNPEQAEPYVIDFPTGEAARPVGHIQSRKHSFIEANVNTFLGLLVTLVVNSVVFHIPRYGAMNAWGPIVEYTVIMTFVSIGRNYIIRRLFVRGALTLWIEKRLDTVQGFWYSATRNSQSLKQSNRRN